MVTSLRDRTTPRPDQASHRLIYRVYQSREAIIKYVRSVTVNMIHSNFETPLSTNVIYDI